MDDRDDFDEIIKSTFNNMNRLFGDMDSFFKTFSFHCNKFNSIYFIF